MKCPHCNYQHGYDYEAKKDIRGLEGEFFSLSVDMRQTMEHINYRERTLYACPKCGKTFIEV